MGTKQPVEMVYHYIEWEGRSVPVREEVIEFAIAMEDILEIYDKDKGDSWKDLTFPEMIDKLDQKVRELSSKKTVDLDRVKLDYGIVSKLAIDTANRALFIHWHMMMAIKAEKAAESVDALTDRQKRDLFLRLKRQLME